MPQGLTPYGYDEDEDELRRLGILPPDEDEDTAYPSPALPVPQTATARPFPATPAYAEYQHALQQGAPTAPQPSRLRRILGGVAGGLMGSLQGPPGEIPKDVAQQRVQAIQYGDFPQRAADWERQLKLKQAASESERQRIQAETGWEQAQGMAGYRNAGNELRRQAEDRQRANVYRQWEQGLGLSATPTPPSITQPTPQLPPMPFQDPASTTTGAPPAVFQPAPAPTPIGEIPAPPTLLPPLRPTPRTAGPQAFPPILPQQRPIPSPAWIPHVSPVPSPVTGERETRYAPTKEEQARLLAEAKREEEFGGLTPEQHLDALYKKLDAAVSGLDPRTRDKILTPLKQDIAARIQSGDVKGANNALNSLTQELVRSAVSSGPEAIAAAVARAVGLEQGSLLGLGATEDDFMTAGQMYAVTGKMPPLGLTKSARVKVQHYMNEYRKGKGWSPNDLVRIQAQYAASAGSLNALQKQRDAVATFEKTAAKNLDLFLSTVSEVIGSGSPLVNTPLRAFSRQVLGDPDMAAFHAAAQVALTEIARVVANPNLVGVLSDSARTEIRTLIPENATPAQIYRVAGVLKQDMANRLEAYQLQLGEVVERLGATTASTTPAPSGLRPDEVKVERTVGGKREVGAVPRTKLAGYVRQGWQEVK